MRAIFMTCFIVGVMLPLTAFVPWVAEHGLSIPQLIAEASATPISQFAWLDVLVAAITLVVWIISEERRHRVGTGWLAIVATLTIGVSAGLPLYLYLRASHKPSSGRDMKHP